MTQEERIKERTENLVITGNKVKRIVTESEDYDVSEMLAEKEKELADHIEGVRLYNESANEIEKQLKKDIKTSRKNSWYYLGGGIIIGGVVCLLMQ